LTLLVRRQEGHPAFKKYGGGEGAHWLVVTSPDGVALIRMVSVSVSVNLPLHHKVQKYSSSTGIHMWSRKKGHKTPVVTINNLRGLKMGIKYRNTVVTSPDGVAPIRIVGVSASVNLPLHQSRSSLLASAYTGGPRKRAITVVVSTNNLEHFY